MIVLAACTNSASSSEKNLSTDDNQSTVKEESGAKLEDDRKESNNSEADSLSKNVTTKNEVYIYTEKKYGKDNSALDFHIFAQDKAGNKLWEKVWKDIQETELEVASEYTIANDMVYIEVSANLYALELQTGREKWGNVLVGSTPAPVVDEDGVIYCAGYYGPFITAVYPDGGIKWQVDDLDQYYWPYEIMLKDNKVYVTFGDPDDNIDTCVFKKQSGDFIDAIASNFKTTGWESITASSILDPNKPNYIPKNIADQNTATAWVEGKEDDGVGEWIKFESPSVQEIYKVDIYNGYQKSYELFQANSRLKAVKIEFSDGTSLIKTFKDDLGKTSIMLGKPVRTTSIKFTILDIYKGKKYSDTCISEISTY